MCCPGNVDESLDSLESFCVDGQNVGILKIPAYFRRRVDACAAVASEAHVCAKGFASLPK
jgi:hypothetical protein